MHFKVYQTHIGLTTTQGVDIPDAIAGESLS
jgi:hypothetical protein